MKLLFNRGTIIIDCELSLPYIKWDNRVNTFRAEAYYYSDIVQYLNNSNIPFLDDVFDLIPCPHFSSIIKLRNYQKEALESWWLSKKGTIVMPTGSGKTILAIKIIEKLNTSTLIIVPTLDLVNQWKKELNKAFNIEIGEFTGNKKVLKAITISTYDSTYLNADNLGNKFNFIVFDEVHHLPSEGYRQIAELFASPFRLGLTATYNREDNLHKELPRLIGDKVYEITPDTLSGTHLSTYEIKKIKIPLTDNEEREYRDAYNTFKSYLISNHIQMNHSNDFKKLIIRSGNDPKARLALLSRNKAEKIAFNSQNKLNELSKLLDKKNRTIIFTKYNNMVYKISKRFLIPCITHQIKKDERNDILTKFKNGKYSTIVSSQVLDEGINVPDANIGIILSGTGSSREYIQRLGRLLRPGKNKKAILYEIISQDTMEVRIANKRKK
ncbi:MAG: DEAD/DEAH box helicase family protein [Candidatus Lokiarchaeota archaeon]|nr:DEAD/DEAH box helicase family protein [Candidatus Lokiarchaeota archaeon]